MRAVRYFQVDAFTTTLFTGNPAGVVLGAEVLDEAEMRAIAREMNNGDTAFVLPPASPAEDLHVRFFTPRKEAAFVGHATLAVHAVLARDESRPLRRQGGRTGVVEVQAYAGRIAIRQPPPPMGKLLGHDALGEVLQCLRLSRGQLDVRCPPRIAGSAGTRLMLALRDTAALDAISPDLAALATLSPQIGAQGYFCFVRGEAAPMMTIQSRMFCPALGIDEDPVSGNAHAMLGAYLGELGLLTPASREAHFSGLQGRHVGRPGRVDVSVESDEEGRITATTIAGEAVVVFETELKLP